jgi:hypothetical protein
MFKRFLVAILALVVCGAQASAINELFSFAWNIPAFGCTGGDSYVTISSPTYLGAGILPTGPVYVVGYQLSAPSFQSPTDYAMLGNLGKNGDTMTAYLYGPGEVHGFYPRGMGFLFDPTQGGQIHLHYACPQSEGSAWIKGVIWYIAAPG